MGLSRRRSRFHVGLRTILVVPFVAQLVLAIFAVWLIARLNSQRAVEHGIAYLRAEIVQRMREFVTSWLDDPHRINEINAAAIEGGVLDPGDTDQLLAFFWNELRVFPRVSYIQYGSEDRSFVGVERTDDGRFRAWLSTGATGYLNCHYAMEEGGRLGEQTLPSGQCHAYDPRGRPWYRAAVETDGPTWSGIYQFSNLHVDQKLADMAVRAVRGPGGKLAGVLGVDLVLSQLGDFLRDLKVGETGVTFIMDRDGGLVAGSTVGLPGVVGPDKKIRRLRADACGDIVIAGTAAELARAFPVLDDIDEPQQLTGRVASRLMFIHVLPFADGRGIDWLLVVVVPEADFMAKIRSGDRLTVLFVLAAFLVAVLMGVVTARRIVQPIRQMNLSARGLARGEWVEELSEDRPDEIGELAASFNQMAREIKGFVLQLEEKVATRTRELDDKNRQLEREILERTRAQEELRRLAAVDALTGAANRRRFRELASSEVERAARYERPLAVVLIDLDHFKGVNDTYGHQAGDDVLRVFAERCRAVGRKTDVFARYGGEEFILLLPETRVVEARVVAERLRSVVAAEPFETCAGPILVTCSLGVAGTEQTEKPALDTLVARADQALYQAKREGRNRVAVWQET